MLFQFQVLLPTQAIRLLRSTTSLRLQHARTKGDQHHGNKPSSRQAVGTHSNVIVGLHPALQTGASFETNLTFCINHSTTKSCNTMRQQAVGSHANKQSAPALTPWEFNRHERSVRYHTDAASLTASAHQHECNTAWFVIKRPKASV